jgi:hypothetical protein
MPARIRVSPLREYLRQANRAQEDIEHERALVSTAAGSYKAVAYLGPLSLHSVNSDANASLPSGIIAARRAYPRAYFKAGHMINACFGGNGQRSNNLTILTGSANTSMTSRDNRVKDALRELYRLFSAFQSAKIALQDIGRCRIRLEVRVSRNKWGANTPDSYITNRVYVRATFQNNPADRSAVIRDTLRSRAAHVNDIDDLQDRIDNLLTQASGTISNRNTGRYT